MSDQDDALLDEDLGDEEYDLGNDEEEALLADDYEIDRQNSYKGEEETDDVLDLGVTDALDDLEGEDENIEYRRAADSHDYDEFYKSGEQTDNHGPYYDNQEEHGGNHRDNYDDAVVQISAAEQNSLNTVDLREKLQKNVQRKMLVGNGQGLEEDDCDEAQERRNRFQTERIMISPKMNSEIPDSLENVVTAEQTRQSTLFRPRGRGRGMRGARGRFAIPGAQANFMPRCNPATRPQQIFNDQKSFRPSLLGGRPSMYPRMSTNNMANHHLIHQQQHHHHHHQQHQHHQQQQQQQQQLHHQQQQHQHQQQQIIYQQNSPQIPQYLENAPQPAAPHFSEHRPPFNPNQFPTPGIQQGPRVIGPPRLEYSRPRGAVVPGGGPPPRYDGPGVVASYMQNRPGPFQPSMLAGNHGPSLLGNPVLHVPGNQPPAGLRVNPGVPQPLPEQRPPPMRDNPINPMMQNFPRMPVANQQPLTTQATFDGRANFQEPPGFMENRTIYEARPHYNNQPTGQLPQGNPMNNSVNMPPQQVGPHLTNVAMPPGHKILINPHFRGTVQATPDARHAWESQQQQQQQPPAQHQPPQQPPQHHPPTSGGAFAQTSSSYQSQDPYRQPAASSQQQQQQPTPRDYQQNYQPVKSDDPYAYFSDVWQENKSQKPQTPSKTFSSESAYSRENYGNYGTKYPKSENTWEHRDSYQEEQRETQNYRDREPIPRPRIDNLPKQRGSASNSGYHESYEQRSRQISSSTRAGSRGLTKRSPEHGERVSRQLSPKRLKTMSNRHESRASTNENASSKKEEDVDPEMREYRKKMEEQKRLREKILQEKENRRKQAAMEKVGDDSRGDSRTVEAVQQPEAKAALVATGVTKDNANPMPPRGRGRPVVNTQTTECSERVAGVRIVRAIPSVEASKTSREKDEKESSSERPKPAAGQTIGTRRVVIQKSLPADQKIATSVQKAVSNLQRTSTVARTVQKTGQTAAGILKKSPGGNAQKSVVNANRIVQEAVGPLRVNVQPTGKTSLPKVVVNTLNNQRVVLQKSTGQTKRVAPDAKTNTVRIENLAASTSESQIRRMCQGIGTLESIHMGDGIATIVFKTQSAALVFHKKYQRKMLDLSLINVRLIQQQQSGSN